MMDTTMPATTPQTIADRLALHGYRIEHLAELVPLCNTDASCPQSAGLILAP